MAAEHDTRAFEIFTQLTEEDKATVWRYAKAQGMDVDEIGLATAHCVDRLSSLKPVDNKKLGHHDSKMLLSVCMVLIAKEIDPEDFETAYNAMSEHGQKVVSKMVQRHYLACMASGTLLTQGRES